MRTTTRRRITAIDAGNIGSPRIRMAVVDIGSKMERNSGQPCRTMAIGDALTERTEQAMDMVDKDKHPSLPGGRKVVEAKARRMPPRAPGVIPRAEGRATAPTTSKAGRAKVRQKNLPGCHCRRPQPRRRHLWSMPIPRLCKPKRS